MCNPELPFPQGELVVPFSGGRHTRAIWVYSDSSGIDLMTLR